MYNECTYINYLLNYKKSRQLNFRVEIDKKKILCISKELNHRNKNIFLL